MKKILQSYYLHFGVLLGAVVWSVAAIWQKWEPCFVPLWGLLPVLILLLAGCVYLCRKRGDRCLPPVWVLWGLLLLAPFYARCGIDALRYGGVLLPIAVLLTMGTMCLLWALLRYAALLIWLPFLFFQVAQIFSYEQYGTRINSLVLAETFEASGEELSTYITGNNLQMLIAVVLGIVLLGVLQVLLLRWRRERLPLINAGLIYGLAGSALACTVPAEHRNNDTWWPVLPANDLAMAFCEAIYHNQATVEQVEALTTPTDKPTGIATVHGGEGVVFVLHIGESVRADRMSLNGYERDTTPWLRQQGGHIISFTDCISAASDTCQAQIAILTNARRDIYDKEQEMQPSTGSVLELFKANGFQVYSFFGRRAAQQLKYDRVVRLLTRCSEERFNAPGSPWTSVPQMEEVLNRVDKKQNLLFFVNNEGSHTPFEHYDRENPPFVPTVHRFENPAELAQEVNNAYDNTVHYTDEYVRRVCQLLHGRPFVYVYVSDHGEYLGHDGMWGRAALGEDRNKYHTTDGCRVGMFVLTSPEFENLHPHLTKGLQQLRAHADTTVAHEHIFHTVLGLFGISTPYYTEALDLTSPQAQPYNGPKP